VNKAEEDPEDGRLAGAVRPEEPEDLARLNLQAEVVDDHAGFGEALAQSNELDWRCACC
jgi:hypothetical protein